MSSSNEADSSPTMQVDREDETTNPQHEGLVQAQSIMDNAKRLEDNMRNLGLKIKEHEGNIKALKSESRKINDSILDMQVALGKYRDSTTFSNTTSSHQSEEDTNEQILGNEKSAASILCLLKKHHGSLPSDLSLMKGVLGIVATLGIVEDENLSRLLSEYLGMETMMAIVCKTYEGVKALEMYDGEGLIDKQLGLHGLGTSIGRAVDGRFLVICLEHLRPYCGEVIPDDPQRRLNIPKPRLSNGQVPPGFISFAVNMINVEPGNLFSVTGCGHGLREILFYNLFSSLQVYKTREDMLRAIPFISDGAISLDGGMIKTKGVFSLGSRNDINLRFPGASASVLPDKYIESENHLKKLKLNQERVQGDISREQVLLDAARRNFLKTKADYIKFLAEVQTQTLQAQQRIDS